MLSISDIQMKSLLRRHHSRIRLHFLVAIAVDIGPTYRPPHPSIRTFHTEQAKYDTMYTNRQGN